MFILILQLLIISGSTVNSFDGIIKEARFYNHLAPN